MSRTIQSTQELIKIVNADIQQFYNKSAGEPEWMDLSDVEDNVNDENILDFINASFGVRNPPLNGTAKEMLEYYQYVVKTMSQFNINPEHISFDFSGRDMSISMLVTPIKEMTEEEYYKKIVWHKGQLISSQKENERELDKVNQIHKSYTESLDDETKQKLNEVHLGKTEHFRIIDQLLSTSIAEVTKEEFKYKGSQPKPQIYQQKRKK